MKYVPLTALLNPPDIKSRYDEEKGLREAADQRLTSLGQDLERHKQDNDQLQTELVSCGTLLTNSLLVRLFFIFFDAPHVQCSPFHCIVPSRLYSL